MKKARPAFTFGVAIGLLVAALALPAARAAGPARGGETVLHAFGGRSDGHFPASGVIRGPDGTFYGTTEGDFSPVSAPDLGTVFAMTPQGTVHRLHQFVDSDGATPLAGLVQGADGSLFGITQAGGSSKNCPADMSSGCGTVFRIAPDGTFFSLYSFTGGLDGSRPTSALTFGADGQLYGTTSTGGVAGYGTAFRISAAGDFATLAQFTGGALGITPSGPLTLASDGNFYGVTMYGGGAGCSNCGVVYRLQPNGGLQTVHAVAGIGEGGGLSGALVEGPDGTLYGTSISGGGGCASGGCGTVYAVTPDGRWTTLYAFKGGADGYNPLSGVVFGADGALYGTTSFGGTSPACTNPRSGRPCGTIFRVTTAGQHGVLFRFNGADGDTPRGTLIQDADGSFVGTTLYGGSKTYGNVFRFNLP